MRRHVLSGEFFYHYLFQCNILELVLVPGSLGFKYFQSNCLLYLPPSQMERNQPVANVAVYMQKHCCKLDSWVILIMQTIDLATSYAKPDATLHKQLLMKLGSLPTINLNRSRTPLEDLLIISPQSTMDIREEEDPVNPHICVRDYWHAPEPAQFHRKLYRVYINLYSSTPTPLYLHHPSLKPLQHTEGCTYIQSPGTCPSGALRSCSLPRSWTSLSRTAQPPRWSTLTCRSVPAPPSGHPGSGKRAACSLVTLDTILPKIICWVV